MINYIIGIGTGLFVVMFVVSKIVQRGKHKATSVGCSACSGGCTKCHGCH